MPPGEEDEFGLVADEGADEFGLVADEPEHDFGPEPEPEGAEAIPAGMRETGRRILQLPEQSFAVDPTGRRPDVFRERGEFTELREVAPTPSGFDRAMSMAGGNPLVALGRAAYEGVRDFDPGAGALGAGRAAAFGFADEARGVGADLATRAVRAGMRPEIASLMFPGQMPAIQRMQAGDTSDPGEAEGARVRSMTRAAEERAPGSFMAGQVVGTAPQLLIPGGAGGLGARVATQGAIGFGLGGLTGIGESEAEDAGGVALDALETGGYGLAGGVGGQLAGEGVSAIARRAGPWLSRLAGGAERGATRSRLEAAGAWGGRAANAAEELPGGQAAMAADFRRLGIGHGVGDPGRLMEAAAEGGDVSRSWLPRSTRTADDAAQVMRDAGGRMDGVLARMDEAATASTPGRTGRPSGLVDLGGAANEMEAVAAELERLPIGGRQAAESLRTQVVAPLREAGAVSFGDAHAQRMHLDRMIRAWSSDPNLATVAGRLQTARRAVSSAMDQAAENVSPQLRAVWRQANRDFSVGAFADEYGRGAERLSVGGGMGGAVGTGAEMAMAGNPLTSIPASLANREMAQQQRMAWPGLRAVTLEALAPRLRAMGPRAQQWAARLEAARGPTARAAAHYAMSRTDPAYRAQVEQMQEQEQGEE